MSNHKKLISVVGPTGSGKTDLAVRLAKKFNGVIISADSRQVYRGLNIGTNKEGFAGTWQGENACEVDEIPQLLIDIINPGERYTLADWLSGARRLKEKIWQNGQLPIVVGGTGLYVSALLDGYDLGEGRDSKKRLPIDFQSQILEINVDRQTLNIKSDARYERIFDNLCVETNELIKSGVVPDWLDKIGLDYRWASRYLRQMVDRETAISSFQKASRDYIRRQLTWWRHHGTPVAVTSYQEAEKATTKFLN